MAPSGPSRRRLLITTRNFPPQIGGIERYVARVLEELHTDYDIALCAPAGAERYVPADVACSHVSMTPLPAFLGGAFWRTLALARRFRPVAVVAGSGLTAPMALLAARWLRVPAVVFVYGLDLVVENAVYQRLWMPAVRRCSRVIAISRYTRELALKQGIRADALDIVTPGVDPITPDPAVAAAFRQHHGLGERPLLLMVGRLTRRKGLVEFVRHCLPGLVAQRPDIVLACVGGDPVTSLAGNRSGLGEEALAAAREQGLEDNLRLLGRLDDDELPAAYQASDVHVFPVRELPGDVEGFGMVALEAAENGVPTVAFASGGIPDAVAPGRSGQLLEPGDYNGMAAAILAIVNDTGWRAARRDACRAFAAEFHWDRLGAQLRSVFSRLLATPEAGRGRT